MPRVLLASQPITAHVAPAVELVACGLRDGSYRDSAGALRDELAADDAPREAVELIERLAQSGAPLVDG